MKGKLVYLTSVDAWQFLKPRHYAGRKPQITRAFGLEIDDRLVAVCTFGKPASNSLCEGVCGSQNSKYVYELNRLCRVDDLEEPLSQFVSACLRRVSAENWIVVSYSDTGMNHNGYIYQACNFIYTGMTKERTDKYTDGGKHSRHYDSDSEYRVVRTPKHRYIYFATRNKILKRQWKSDLQYQIEPFPKGENKNYTLGQHQMQTLIKISGGVLYGKKSMLSIVILTQIHLKAVTSK